MSESVFKTSKTSFTSISVSKKMFGIWFEFWIEYKVFGDVDSEFFKQVRDKYKKKFKGQTFRMVLNYPNDMFEVKENTVIHKTYNS